MKMLLFGMLFASPAAGIWLFRSAEVPAVQPVIRPVSYSSVVPAGQSVVRIPVEVLKKGSAPQWVYVEVGNHPVPEPGMVSLLALASLLLTLRRQRE